MATYSIGYVNSSKEQQCFRCGKRIPRGEQSVKITKKMRGRISLTETKYHCMDCENAGKEPDHDEH